jgi:hypothetical protein
MLIIKNNQTSPIAVFTESSMDFRYLKDFKSAVVTLPTVAYGAHIAAYMSTQAKEERDANQLIETFAGLAKSTMDRFRYFSVITSESYKASGFRDNWTKWGHITIDYGFERFFERFKVDQAGILSEINASSRPT